MSEKQKKLIANRKKTTTTIVQVVYVEWKLFGIHRQNCIETRTKINSGTKIPTARMCPSVR